MEARNEIGKLVEKTTVISVEPPIWDIQSLDSADFVD